MLFLLFALSGDVEAHLVANIDAYRTVAVELAYELTLDGAPPGMGELAFTLLEMDGARIENLRVGQDQRPLRLERSGAPKLETAVAVGPGEAFITFYYETVGATIRSWFRASLPLRRAPGRSLPSCDFPTAPIYRFHPARDHDRWRGRRLAAALLHRSWLSAKSTLWWWPR